MKVTPYEVSGDIDYDKLVKEFGVTPWDEALSERFEKVTGHKPHHMIRRGIIVSHRDMNWLLDEYEKGNKFALYTGRGPSGDIHLGHLVVWMFAKWLADVFDVEMYFQMTDDEKFYHKPDLKLEDATALARENALDVIALGFKSDKTFIFSDIEASGFLYPLAAKVAKTITGSTMKGAFGFTDSHNVGQYFYTSMQAVPCMIPSIVKGKPTNVLIPLGIDQDVHFRITRDSLPKLGFSKPAILHSIFLPGLEGSGKSSSSEGHVIASTDSPDEIKRKINKYALSGGKDSLEEHREKGGDPTIDVAFIYLQFFLEDDEELESLRTKYLSGELTSGEMKARCIEVISDFLTKHQAAREAAKSQIDEYMTSFDEFR